MNIAVPMPFLYVVEYIFHFMFVFVLLFFYIDLLRLSFMSTMSYLLKT